MKPDQAIMEPDGGTHFNHLQPRSSLRFFSCRENTPIHLDTRLEQEDLERAMVILNVWCPAVGHRNP